MSSATKSGTLLRFEPLKGTITKAHRALGAVLSTNLKGTGHFVVTSPTHRVESTDVVPCLPTHTTTARKDRGKDVSAFGTNCRKCTVKSLSTHITH
jgi:hypothetical protein